MPPAPASRTSSGTTPRRPPPPRSWPPRNDTIAGLRDQLTRAQAALDRERAEQHKTVSLLHDILTSRPAVPAGSDREHPRAAGGTGREPAATAGNGTGRRHAPPR